MREVVVLTWYTSLASMVPLPRIWVVIAPDWTYCTAASGREAFMMVLEKKVRTSMTAKKMMATFLTQPLFLTFCSVMLRFPPSFV